MKTLPKCALTSLRKLQCIDLLRKEYGRSSYPLKGRFWSPNRRVAAKQQHVQRLFRLIGNRPTTYGPTQGVPYSIVHLQCSTGQHCFTRTVTTTTASTTTAVAVTTVVHAIWHLLPCTNTNKRNGLRIRYIGALRMVSVPFAVFLALPLCHQKKSFGICLDRII